jgi:hypothetical protein
MAERQDPRIKSIRLASVRLVDNITGKLVLEDNTLQAQKLSAALTVLNISLIILNDDPLRASRMLSNARRLANIKDIEEG